MGGARPRLQHCCKQKASVSEAADLYFVCKSACYAVSDVVKRCRDPDISNITYLWPLRVRGRIRVEKDAKISLCSAPACRSPESEIPPKARPAGQCRVRKNIPKNTIAALEKLPGSEGNHDQTWVASVLPSTEAWLGTVQADRAHACPKQLPEYEFKKNSPLMFGCSVLCMV